MSLLGAVLALAAPIGDFDYLERADPINDTLQVAATLTAPQAELSIVCRHDRAKTVYVILTTREALAFPPSRMLREFMKFDYRVDQEPAVNAFAVYDVQTALIEGAQARAFAERLSKGSSIFVRVDGLSSTIDASFSAAGAAEAVRTVATKCGDTRLLKRLAGGSK